MTHVKILIQHVTQGKIADTSETIPVRIRGVPICEPTGIQKNSHMGSPRTHNEIVRIWGLTCILRRAIGVDYVTDEFVQSHFSDGNLNPISNPTPPPHEHTLTGRGSRVYPNVGAAGCTLKVGAAGCSFALAARASPLAARV